MRFYFVIIIFLGLCNCKDLNNRTKIINVPLKDSATIVRDFLDQDTLITVHESKKVFRLLLHNIFLTYKEISRDTTSVETDTTVLHSDALGMYEINVPKSQRYEIKFPDDSRVWLNAATKFRFNADHTDTMNFGIVGEAYFINKKAATIVSPNIKVYSETGSKINVRCYKNESSIIYLLKGIANVNSSRLNAGDCAYINGQIRVVPRCCKEDPDDPISWTKGILSFEIKNCREVFNDLNRWYKHVEYYGFTNCDVAGRLPLSLTIKDLVHFFKLNNYNISYGLDSSFRIIIKQ